MTVCAAPLIRATLARLAGGVAYNAGFQTHAGTETCPGHSTLLTGKHPAIPGARKPFSRG